MVSLQADFPDGSGFPPPNENRFLHEFVRLFHIISYYDELTNPAVFSSVFARFDALTYLEHYIGEYRYNRERFSAQAKFDAHLLKEFTSMLAPRLAGEKVHLYKRSNRSSRLFTGRVHSYLGSYLPLVMARPSRKPPSSG
jgi:hypothetical protein